MFVDTQGLLVHAVIHAANIQGRDGGMLLMATLFVAYPFLLKLYADGGYAGPRFQAGLAHVMRQVNVKIVKRSGYGEGLRRPAGTLNCGADHHLPEPLPHDGQRLELLEPTRARALAS